MSSLPPGKMGMKRGESVSVSEFYETSKRRGTMLFTQALSMNPIWQLAIEFAAIKFDVSIVEPRSISQDSACLIY